MIQHLSFCWCLLETWKLVSAKAPPRFKSVCICRLPVAVPAPAHHSLGMKPFSVFVGHENNTGSFVLLEGVQIPAAGGSCITARCLIRFVIKSSSVLFWYKHIISSPLRRKKDGKTDNSGHWNIWGQLCTGYGLNWFVSRYIKTFNTTLSKVFKYFI